ncbi:hypothetical protein FGG78_23640 [Thioclava sp. BHET1]|nr:hypothetical protein FGG78_23640 [Thioclava sp. BHET1]
MPKRLRFTRRFPVMMTEDAFRRLRKTAAETGLSEDELLVFLFENLGSVLDDEKFGHRLRLFRAELEARRA